MTMTPDPGLDDILRSQTASDSIDLDGRTHVCGTVQGEQRYERAVTARDVTTTAQGRLTHVTLLVPGPSGTPFALAVRVTSATAGRELLQARDITPGTSLYVIGQLAWEQTADPRFAVQWTEQGRRSLDAILYASVIRTATPDDVPGCDVTLRGTVTRPPRSNIHPLTSERIYTAHIEIHTEQQRPHSRARITLTQHVSVTIPRDHPHALALLRDGNVVQIEGVLERIAIPLSIQNRAFQRKLAAAETEWAEHAATLTARGAPGQLARDRQRWERQHRQLLEVTSCRIVAGYVGLLNGKPLTRAEQRALDQRRTGRRLTQHAPQQRTSEDAPRTGATTSGRDNQPVLNEDSHETSPANAPTTRARRKATPLAVVAASNGSAPHTNSDSQQADVPADDVPADDTPADDVPADETVLREEQTEPV